MELLSGIGLTSRRDESRRCCDTGVVKVGLSVFFSRCTTEDTGLRILVLASVSPLTRDVDNGTLGGIFLP